MAYKKYLQGFFGTFIPLIALILTLTVGIDPYESFHHMKIPRVNAVKTAVHENMRLYKANRILAEKPNAIILGSSRIMAGINPCDLEEITEGKAYNCGIAAATFEEMYKYFLHALYANPNLKTVILGLDFFNFNEYEEVKEDLPKFLHGENNRLLHLLPLMFSFSAIKTSAKMLYYNILLKPPHIFYQNGLFNPEIAASKDANPIMPIEMEYIKSIHKVGMYRLFKVKESAIEKYVDLVNLCKSLNITLKVFINPAQAAYWEAMFQHGYWDELENLKSRLSQIHPLWDFGGFNAITTQIRKCPENILYYECSHFRPLLGKVILDILFNRNHSPIQFGYYLEPNTIENAFLTMRKEREGWANAYPEIVAELRHDIKDETHLVIK